MKIQVIVNASAGGGQGEKLFPVLRDKVKALGLAAECTLSRHRREALDIALEAQRNGAERIAACGGDGTVHSLLPAMVHRSAALGIIPLGTANDLARAWKIPLNWSDALKLFVQGPAHAVDVIVTDSGEYIAGAGGVGFDAAVVDRAISLRKRWRGLSPFFAAFVREFVRFHPPRLSLRAENWDYEGVAWQVLFTKISRYAFLMDIAHDVRTDDGLMEICLIPDLSKGRIIALWPFLLLGGLKHLPGVKHFRSSQLRVDASPSLPFHGDGEVMGKTPVTLRILPRALQVIRPATASHPI